MAIFSNTAFTPVVEENVEDLYPEIMPTSESAYEIAVEGYHDMHKLVSGLYVSDILIENAVMEGSEAQPLIEATVKELAAKAKAKILAIWEKIKAWFKKVWENLKLRMTSSKDFVKKYKDQITKKDTKGFKVTKHNFDEKVKESAMAMMDKVVNFAKAEGAKGTVSDDFVTSAVKSMDSAASDMSELKKNFVKKHVGESKADQTITSSDVSNMVSYCEGVDRALAAIKDLENKNAKLVKDMTSSLDGSGENVDVVNAKVRNFNFALRAIQELNATSVEIIKKINSEYVSILRSLMLYKPAKESFTPDAELLKESSIFESALKMI